MAEGRISLLVVDDDDYNRDMLSRRLEKKGYAVAVAVDGLDAIEKIRDRSFDLILLDVMMPGLNGLEVLKTVRQTLHSTDLPIIMATARGESTDIVAALELGANDYVTKPLDFPVVLARVQTQIALKRTIDQVKLLEQSLEERNRELEATNSRLASINGRMSRDLKAAARIQEAFLPTDLPVVPGLDFAWLYRPCDELAGDGLHVVPLGRGKVGLYIFDVSGHGVASALLSVSISRLLSAPSDPSSILCVGGDGPDRAEPTPPGEVAARLNRRFPFDPATSQFATVVYGVLDSVSGEFRYASAGHPGPLLQPIEGTHTLLDGSGFPIGVMDDVVFEERSVQIRPGDRLWLYSDGVPEASDPAGVLMGEPRMIAAMDRSLGLNAAVSGLMAAVDGWRGPAGAQDDISILAVEMTRPIA